MYDHDYLELKGRNIRKKLKLMSLARTPAKENQKKHDRI